MKWLTGFEKLALR